MKGLSGKLAGLGRKAAIPMLLVAAFALGLWIRGAPPGPAAPTDQEKTALAHEAADAKAAAHEGEEEIQLWTCSMHPQVKLPKPGKCPICFMDLIPLEKGAEGDSERVLVMSQAAKALAAIETRLVEHKFVTAEIRMVGKVEYDETRVAYITAWMPGRLDRLYVDYTGVPVKKGEHLVYIYSPELYWAQQALIEALKSAKDMERSDSAMVKEMTLGRVESAREKLRFLGLKPEQVQAIEQTGKISDHMTIYAPIGGIVVHKNAVEGMYVETGTRIYTIADLTRVWVMLDAYESDLAWIRYGQDVEFITEAHPGRKFTGRISFTDPVLNAQTRTVKVRLNVDNSEGLLKPGMFVRAVLRSKVAADGRVMDPRLAGKWICSMHPEVVKDEPGLCDECEMPLVRAEGLGFANLSEDAKPPLVIPATAPLITGKRAVVYVEVADAERPTFEGREVVLGPRAGDYYLVRSGLEEGERVVTRGNFKIDSALQIQAKPSMMSVPGGVISARVAVEPSRLKVPEAFREQLTRVLTAYLAVGAALAADKSADATAAAKQLADALAVVDMKILEGPAHMEWMKEHSTLQKLVAQLGEAKAIAGQREVFALLSESLPPVLKRFGHNHEKPVIRFHCPMAFNNRGATWLQDSAGVRNPYFGAEMLECGSDVERIAAGATQ